MCLSGPDIPDPIAPPPPPPTLEQDAPGTSSSLAVRGKGSKGTKKYRKSNLSVGSGSQPSSGLGIGK